MRASRSAANPSAEGSWETSSDMPSASHERGPSAPTASVDDVIVVAVGAERLADRCGCSFEREAVDVDGGVGEVELRHVVGGHDVDVGVGDFVAGDDDAHPCRIEGAYECRSDRVRDLEQ